MDDDDPEHSERSAEKRLDLALRELGKLMDGALGQVQQMIDDEVDLDPGEIERLFEALRLNTLERLMPGGLREAIPAPTLTSHYRAL